ncbi:peptidase [Algibacter lectus]|uniref:Peptidase n=1 Tax=Algibacter lectus TaxID=221126 RepID=A0A090X513_9FLAO|nr:peptidase [Algibacter lectus]
MKPNYLSLLSGLAFLSVVACKTDEKKETIAQVETVPGINLEFMDTTTKPNDDFFRYVNGKWLDNNEIPSDRTRWGSFDELRQKTDDDALTILKAALSTDKDLKKTEIVAGSDQDKAVKLYQTIMDTIARDKQGIEPLKPYLAKIDAIENIQDLQDYIIEMESKSGSGFVGFYVGAHPKDSNKMLVT